MSVVISYVLCVVAILDFVDQAPNQHVISYLELLIFLEINCEVIWSSVPLDFLWLSLNCIF